jgi:hypothetical protein
VLQLSQLLEAREVHIGNLEASSSVHKNLVDLLSLAGASEDSSAGSNSAEPVFDHEQCHDCSYVQSISRDCVTHLQNLTKQTVDASQRLLQLVELRERVRDSAEFLRLEEDLLSAVGNVSLSPQESPLASK